METLCPLSLATYSIKPLISFYLTLRTVTVGSLYLCGLILFSTDDREVTDCFSVFSVLRGLFYQFQQFERTFHFCKTKEVHTEGEHSGAAVVFVEVALQTFQATCLDAYFAA